MRKLILIILLLTVRCVFAQDNELPPDLRPLNSISVTLFGGPSNISMGYEREFFITPTFLLTTKLGFGFNKEIEICLLEPCAPPEAHFTIPQHITANVGKGKYFFEFGFGGTVVTGTSSQHYIPYPILGFRILPEQAKKVNFRLFTAIPIAGHIGDVLFVPVGLNLGVSF